ncbi:hypothetical protein QSV08_12450 [Maribacter sp. BPC-D8]|uniref:hypothetical protein n=1 Tax=Maribacter sp. BPC-D8 TaxID=3053613 RepID=UPI002B488AE9|nr:hypothetical protein [Maribacter sp. BPC-D8]WRI28035.1 hypothetical protein QSV08_12450 [Maribacter sp. BPC-D8]
MPSDKDYKSAKKIKQGISKINKEFESLAEWIDQKYEVKTLNIFFDYIHNNKAHPRLQICLEHARDKGKFMDNRTYNFDKAKQKEIANKFEEFTTIDKNKSKPSFLKTLFGLKRKTDNLYVYFTEFESIAKMEANLSIPDKEIKKLKDALNNDELWEIAKRFSGVTYFFYTDEQLKNIEYSKTHKKWSEQYFELLQNYDEFGYFKKDYFNVHLDSKENFDNNYESNWYYYYK